MWFNDFGHRHRGDILTLLGINYEAFSDSERSAVVQQHPRTDYYHSGFL
ncbi:hypothetical protein [Photorhabdus australis]|nr:hypothetical protein [Photorhabdus australis]